MFEKEIWFQFFSHALFYFIFFAFFNFLFWQYIVLFYEFKIYINDIVQSEYFHTFPHSLLNLFHLGFSPHCAAQTTFPKFPEVLSIVINSALADLSWHINKIGDSWLLPPLCYAFFYCLPGHHALSVFLLPHLSLLLFNLLFCYILFFQTIKFEVF